MTRYKLLTENEKVGVWVDDIEYLKILKLVKYRNKKFYEHLKDKYEKLTEKSFDDSRLEFA